MTRPDLHTLRGHNTPFYIVPNGVTPAYTVPAAPTFTTWPAALLAALVAALVLGIVAGVAVWAWGEAGRVRHDRRHVAGEEARV